MPSNPDQTAVAIPQDNIDKLLAAFQVTWSFTDSLSGKSGFFDYIPARHLIKAIYSYDGGATWKDCGPSSNWSGFSLQPPVGVNIFSDLTGRINISVTQSALVNGGNPWTLRVKIAWAPMPETPTFDTSYAYFEGLNAYDSDSQYLDIAAQGSFIVSSASAATTTIAHNLGYVPFFDVWSTSPTTSRLQPHNSNFGNSGSAGDGAWADETNIYINTGSRVPTENIAVYYKIYKED